MTKHTPGPVCPACIRDTQFPDTPESHEAALLTQQRDTLLAAAKAMMAWFDAEDEPGPRKPYPYHHNLMVEAERMTRAAIAEAEGQGSGK